MPLDQSQISRWLIDWRGKRSRREVSLESGVPEKNIQRYEIEGVSPPAETFLLLVQFYRRENELADWLAEQRARRGAKRAHARATSRGAETEAEGG